MKLSKLTVSVLLCSSLVVACGGGSGGASGSGTPNAGAATGWNANDVGNYFPLKENSKWTYWESEGAAVELKKTKMLDVSLGGIERTVASTSATFGERIDMDALPIQLKVERTENTLNTLVQTVSWLSQKEMVPDIDFTVKQGTVWSSVNKIGLAHPYDLDGDGKTEVADVVQSGSFDGYESVMTEAGEFKLAAKISNIHKETIHFSRPPANSTSTTSTRVRWFAKGVGLVKEVTTLYAGTPYASVTTRELKAYIVDEKNIGFSFPVLLQDDIGTDDSDYQQVVSQPAISSNGDGYLLATTREADPYPYDQSISIVRMDRNLTSLGSSTIACSWHCGQPAMVFGANAYFLSYNSDENVSFQRFQANGLAIDNASVPIGDRGPFFDIRRMNPVVASSGQNYFVAYTLADNNSGPEHKQTGIYGAIISAEGKILKSDMLIRPLASMLQNYSVEYGAGVYFLVFSDGQDVSGVRISEGGNLLDNSPISISAAPDLQIDSRIVFDGTNFIVAWGDRRNHRSSPDNLFPLIMDIYATRVSPQGGLLDGDAATGGALLESSSTPKQMVSLARTNRGIFLGWPSGTYATATEIPGIYLKPLDTATSLKAGGAYFVSGVPKDNSARLGMFYSGVALITNSDELIAAWVDNSVSLTDKRHKRIIGARAKLATLPIH